MGLAGIQRVLALLSTDQRMRERFFQDPQGIAAELGLDAAEAQVLAQLSARQVSRFARSLHAKRLGEIQKLLPLTFRVMGEGVAPLFRSYAESSIPQGMAKHRDDALRFACVLEQAARREQFAPEWALAVLRYEKAWLLASSGQRRLTIARFRYAIGTLIRSLEKDPAAPQVLTQPTLALWIRVSRGGPLHHLLLPLPAFRLPRPLARLLTSPKDYSK